MDLFKCRFCDYFCGYNPDYSPNGRCQRKDGEEKSGRAIGCEDFKLISNPMTVNLRCDEYGEV